MLNHILIVLVFIIILLLPPSSFAQSGQQGALDLQKVTFASPEIQGLGKYGQTPVQMFSGIPEIQIPVYEVNIGNCKVPISFSYNAGGIKVEEIASWTGLGWSLQAGASITRQVNGLPDEYGQGFYNTGGEIMEVLQAAGRIPPMSPATLNSGIIQGLNRERVISMSKGFKDGEPDIFHFTAGQYAGQFFFDNNRKILQSPYQNVKIEGQTGITGGWRFIITTPEGVIYTFEQYREYIEPSLGAAYTSAWFVEKITDQIGNEVLFKYTTTVSNIQNLASETKYISLGASCLPTDDRTYMHTQITSRKIDSIITRKEIIKFFKTNNRQDIQFENSLDSINIYNREGKCIKQVGLYHSYFSGIPSIAYNSLLSTNPTSRFRLDSIKINKGEKYHFVYDLTPLPERLSLDQDLWGYYNHGNNTSLVPSYFKWQDTANYMGIQGGNRSPDLNYAKAGTLKKIHYPTGGSTEFEYESNEVYDRKFTGLVYVDPWIAKNAGGYFSSWSGVFTTQVFYIKRGSTQLNVMVKDLNNNPGYANYIQVRLVDSATNGGIISRNLQNGVPITNLPPGPYKIIAQEMANRNTSYIFSVTWQEPSIDYNDYMNGSNQFINRKIGGLRIKSITDIDAAGGPLMITKYRYHQENDTAISSGKIGNYPLLLSTCKSYCYTCLSTGPVSGNYYKYTSYSQNQLSFNSGSMIGYSYITVFKGDSTRSGKTVYHYTNYDSNPDYTANFQMFPYPAASNQMYNRGLLLDTKIFESFNNTYRILENTENKYTFASNFLNAPFIACGIKAANNFSIQIAGPPGECTWTSDDFFNSYHFTETSWLPFSVSSVWNQLDSTIVHKYSYSGTVNKLTQITSFSYSSPYNNDLLLMKSSELIGSNGSRIVSRFKYTADFKNITAAAPLSNGIKKLLNKNITNRLIENTTWIGNAGQEKLSKAVFIEQDTAKLLPQSTYTIEQSTLLNDFVPATVTTGEVVRDPRYIKAVAFEKYDDWGNIIQQRKENNVLNAYIWDYQHTLPVAHIINGSSDRIAYSSFEADDPGGWTINSGFVIVNNGGITGKKTVNGGVSKTVPTDNYVVSVWCTTNLRVNGQLQTQPPLKTVGPWQYFEVKLNNISTITVTSDNMDEVRLYPQGAQMITYTYDPLVGITSQCDANSNITYYEYDALGKLMHVRDQHRNILKKIDYRYQQQAQP